MGGELWTGMPWCCQSQDVLAEGQEMGSAFLDSRSVTARGDDGTSDSHETQGSSAHCQGHRTHRLEWFLTNTHPWIIFLRLHEAPFGTTRKMTQRTEGVSCIWRLIPVTVGSPGTIPPRTSGQSLGKLPSMATKGKNQSLKE